MMSQINVPIYSLKSRGKKPVIYSPMFFGNFYLGPQTSYSNLEPNSVQCLDNNLTPLSFFNYILLYNLGVHLAVDPNYIWIGGPNHGGPNHDGEGEKHVEYSSK